MQPGAWGYARARAQLGLLLALAGTVLAGSVALIGVDALHRTAEREAVTEALVAGPATSAALNIEISAERADKVDARIRSAPFTVVRTVHTDGFPAVHDGSARTFAARSDPGLRARSTLVEGRWPQASAGRVIHAALQSRAAQTLRIGVGDRLHAGSGDAAVEIVVDGTWRPNDPAATAWFGDPSSASGAGPQGAGPLVVSEAELARLPAPATTSYVLTPRPSADPSATRRDVRRLIASVDDPELTATVTGGLPERLAELAASRGAGDGLLAVAYTLLALTALVACRQVVALLTEARRTETALVRARGGTVPAMTTAASLEALVTAVVGAATGSIAAVAVFDRLDRPPDGGLVVLVAVLSVLVTVALAGLATWSSVRHAGLRRAASRDAAAGRTAALLLALAAAALTVGQFIAYDGPLTVDADGARRVDPITSLAPAVALAALTLLGAAAAEPLLRLLERRTGRRTGLVPALPASQLARRLPTFGVAIVLVSLAVGFMILVATVRGTQTSLDDTAARVRSAADARLDLTVDASAEVGVESATAPLMGLGNRAVVVVVAPARVDQDEVAFLAAPARVTDVAAEPPVHADSVRVASLLHARPQGVPIRAGSVDVRVEVEGAPIASDLRSTIWLVDDSGQLAARPVGVIGPKELAAGPVTRTVSVPANPRPWRLLAVAADAPGAAGDATIIYQGLPGAQRYEAVLANGQSRANALVGTTATRLPVVITPAVAALLHVGRGDTFDVLLPDSELKGTVTVAGIVNSIPGLTADRGIAADLPTLASYALAHNTSVPAPSSVWVATDRPGAVARQAVNASVVQVATTTAAPARSSKVVDSAVDVWWWAAGSVIVFAALATAAMTSSLSRTRRGELQVLRALGLTPRRQSRTRSSELVGAVSTGAVIGVLAGAVTVLLTATTLSRSATPGRPASVDPELSLFLPGLIGLVGMLVTGMVAVAVTYARRVRREARQTAWRGDEA